VSSRSLDGASNRETSLDDLESINIPAELEFEGGDVGEDGVRDKRTPRFIFRTVSCLFTFLVNPNCLQGITGGGGGGGGGDSGSSSYGSSSNRRQESQPYYMISLPRYNDSDSNGTATEYPIYPIESTSEYYPDDTTSRPTNPILAMIRWKMNLIPNLLRRFFPRFGGSRADGGGGGSPFGFNLANFGGGRLAGLFGGGQNGGGGGGGFGGLGGLAGLLGGGRGGGGQY